MMRSKFLRITAAGIALAALGIVCLMGLHAQPSARPGGLSTNWVGKLVIGKVDTMDAIARGPYPATDRSVEIGLRSDGVVVWRAAGSH